MKNSIWYLASLIFAILCGCNQPDSKMKLTAINPLAYTDVSYFGLSDTVIISTYSGRIAKRIKGQQEEQIIAQLNDEIYSIVYAKKRNEIISSTLESGIVIIDPNTGEIIKTINNGIFWSNHLILSTDGTILGAVDVKGNNYLWDVANEYQPIEVTDSTPKGYLRYINNQGDIYFTGGGKVTIWNSTKDSIIEYKVGGKLIDIDYAGNLVLLNHDEVTKFNIEVDSIQFTRKHPDWVFLMLSGDTARIPLQMKLTTGITSKNKIFSAGVDRSIRVWNSLNGKLIDELIYHRATISSLDKSADQKQLVSVDLRGGIKFWEIN